jgi:bifunctional non-homologous end joining protein LigD
MFRRLASAVATSREGHRSPRSTPAGQHQRWGRGRQLAIKTTRPYFDFFRIDRAGRPVFDRLRGRRHDRDVFLFAFDLLELNGRDLRRRPIEDRKTTLAKLLRGAKPGLHWNEHIEEPGDIVFRHACKLGLEGIVSKRLGSPYRSGRSRDWIKMKNPAAPAVKREAEEYWGR